MWKPQRRIETDYQRQLHQLFVKFGEAIITSRKHDLIMRMTNEIVKSPWFKNFAQFSVERMITMTRNDTAKSWREAARQSSHGREIYEALKRETDQDKIYQELFARNMYYIKSAPIDMAERMSKLAEEEQLKGKRPEWISEQLKALFPGIAKAKANLIARTEASKVSSELVQARAEKLGYNWYTWKTSSDQRVRRSHAHMEGVLIRYDNPPSPERLRGEKSYGEYNAGETFNCRCYASVMFDVDEISWPHKVYYGKRIVTMTKKQFREIM